MKIVLAVVLIALLGIQSAFADTDIVRKAVHLDGVGSLAYAMTYQGATATVAGPVLNSVTQGTNWLQATVTGIDVTGATQINAFMAVQSHKNAGTLAIDKRDTAWVSMAATGPDASTKNYCMYGYVTPDFAWAGQYADSIKGTQVDLLCMSYNAKAAPVALPLADADLGPSGTAATMANLGANKLFVFKPSPAGTDEFAWCGSEIFSPAGTGPYTLTTMYQTADASSGSLWPNGMWAMTQVDKKAKVSAVLTATEDRLTLANDAFYQNGATKYWQTPGDYGNQIWLVTPGTLGSTISAATNSPSMSYADPTVLYVNWDVRVDTAGPGLFGYTTSSNQQGITILASTNTAINPTTKVVTTPTNLFLYSLVNSKVPSGTSQGIIY